MASYYSLDQAALLKILLHSLKFPTSPVNGFLLGEERKEAAHPSASPPVSPRGVATRRVLHIHDAIPVSHNYLTLTMPVEAALIQLQEYCKRQGNLRVVGYYQCNERLDETDLGESGKRIANKLEAAFPGSIALVLDGRALRDLISDRGSTLPPVRLLHKDNARGWINAPTTGNEASFKCPSEGVAGLMSSLIKQGKHHKLVDFEDHLDDITLDWLNKEIL